MSGDGASSAAVSFAAEHRGHGAGSSCSMSRWRPPEEEPGPDEPPDESTTRRRRSRRRRRAAAADAADALTTTATAQGLPSKDLDERVAKLAPPPPLPLPLPLLIAPLLSNPQRPPKANERSQRRTFVRTAGAAAAAFAALAERGESHEDVAGAAMAPSSPARPRAPVRLHRPRALPLVPPLVAWSRSSSLRSRS